MADFDINELDRLLGSSFALREVEMETSYLLRASSELGQAEQGICIYLNRDGDIGVEVAGNRGELATFLPENLIPYRSVHLLALGMHFDATRRIELDRSEPEAGQRLVSLLNSSNTLPSLETGATYCRTHDDGDGDLGQRLYVSRETDNSILVAGKCYGMLRFRTSFGGGGANTRTRNALLLVALAAIQTPGD